MAFQDDCDFCSIAAGKDASAQVVAEGDSWVAFFPIDPATPGHTLIIPRTHVSNLWETEPPLDAELMRACVQLGRVIQSALDVKDMNLITSDGTSAEQTVFHLHLHLVPRWPDDGFGQIWPHEANYENSALGDVARTIRSAWSESNQ